MTSTLNPNGTVTFTNCRGGGAISVGCKDGLEDGRFVIGASVTVIGAALGGNDGSTDITIDGWSVTTIG